MKWHGYYERDENGGYIAYHEGLKSKLEDFWSGCLPILVIVGVLLLMFSCFIGVGYQSCNKGFEDSSMNHRFNFWSGCMVEAQPNQWIPSDNYIFVEPKGQ
jgi:hypothetical protein